MGEQEHPANHGGEKTSITLNCAKFHTSKRKSFDVDLQNGKYARFILPH